MELNEYIEPTDARSIRSVCPQFRRGFKSPSHSISRLKPTEKNLNIIVKNESFSSFPGSAW
jgi:hypothetical protein